MQDLVLISYSSMSIVFVFTNNSAIYIEKHIASLSIT